MSPCDPSPLQLTRSTATQLARQIAGGQVTAAAVLEAHIQRIQQVNPQLNAVVVALWQQARREAHQADAARSRGQWLGPLHGVPVTVKELLDVADAPTTAGLDSRTSHRAQRDAVVVERVRRAGAIVLAKTNAPQLGMMVETDNPVYGRTNNPWNLARTPGGSSGGDGAIVAACGTPLALASDGGGSIRIPAHACGVHGLKPTSGRLSLVGHWGLPNWPAEWVQPGPIARSVEDLWLAMQALVGDAQEPAGPDVIPAPLRDPSGVPIQRLRIGMYAQLGEIVCCPAVRRATAEAAEALRQRGATVVPLDVPDLAEAWRLCAQVLHADGFYYLRQAVKGSRVDWRIRHAIRLARVPTWSRPAVARVLEWMGQRHLGRVFRLLPRRAASTPRYLELIARQRAYRQRFDRALKRQELDAILSPACPSPALLHGRRYANVALVYTALYNLLGMPAGVVSITRVREHEQTDRDAGRDRVERELARVEADSAGLPVGVQVAAPWWREDVVLAVMGVLEQHFQSCDDYPRCPP